jgi:mandelate racemase
VRAHLLATSPTCHWLALMDWGNAILAQPIEVKDGHVVLCAYPDNGSAWNEEAAATYVVP